MCTSLVYCTYYLPFFLQKVTPFLFSKANIFIKSKVTQIWYIVRTIYFMYLNILKKFKINIQTDIKIRYVKYHISLLLFWMEGITYVSEKIRIGQLK